jgi:hypothetical protein
VRDRLGVQVPQDPPHVALVGKNKPSSRGNSKIEREILRDEQFEESVS